MRKVRADAFALAALAGVSIISSSGVGCSGTKPTELVPGVSSQVVVPRDLKAVRVTVETNGRAVFDQGYDVGANNTVQLPSTLGIVSGESAQTVVTITIRGYETTCEATSDCNTAGSDVPVGTSGGSQILRRSIQTFVDQHTLFVPMPLTYSCWNTDCGDQGMACKGNTCVDSTTEATTLVDFDPSLLDGTDVCFSPKTCFGDDPEAGKNEAVAPELIDPATCTYAIPAIPGVPAGQLNVRAYYQNFTWTKNTSGIYEPVLNTGGEQEILNQDPIEGFTLVTSSGGTSEAGAPASGLDASTVLASGVDSGTGLAQTTFRLAPGLCTLVQQASNPPQPPPTGAGTYITISALRVANLCPPKSPLLPICAGEQTNGPALPSGEVTTDGTCNVGVSLTPTQSALYLLMDHSTAMHGAFGPKGSAQALSVSLSDPVFKRTYAAFNFLPANPMDCSGPTTAFTTPGIPFDLAATVQPLIAAQIGVPVADSTDGGAPTPLDLQAGLRLDTGAYASVVSLLKTKAITPNIAAAMFFVNRTPDLTNDCSPPLDGQPTVKGALEAEIQAAFSGSPSLQTYFVVLDDDAHDSATPTGALTFFQQVQADLPQAVQVLDATQGDTSMQGAEAVAANFSSLVTQLGTCLYDYELPTGTDPRTVQISYQVPNARTGALQTITVPSAGACTAANQNAVDGWGIDNGRLRICGNSCNTLRQGILNAAAIAMNTGTAAQDVPVSAQILCNGTAAVNDAGPVFSVDAGNGLEGFDATVGNSDGGTTETDSGFGVGSDDSGTMTAPVDDAAFAAVDDATP